MAGFRLTDGSDGCPPTAVPPADYENPFRLDSAGRLWITSCFQGMQYFGAARHGMSIATIGGASVPVFGGLSEVVDGTAMHVTAGTYTDLVINNATQCTMGIMLGHDGGADMEAHGGRSVSFAISSRWNGNLHSISEYSNPKITGSTANIRMIGGTSANPHDTNVEAGGGPGLVIGPGASATVGVRVYVGYLGGSPTGTEYIHTAASAVRVYGYVI